MIDNAVAHVKHLREQGKPASEAVEHAMQRYGVSRKDLLNRVNGYVADRDATQDALAEAKFNLMRVKRIQASRPGSGEDDELPEAWALLLRLYEAVTGETL